MVSESLLSYTSRLVCVMMQHVVHMWTRRKLQVCVSEYILTAIVFH